MLEMTNRRFFFCLAIAFVIGCLMTSAGHKRCPEPSEGTYEQGYAAGQVAAYADCLADDDCFEDFTDTGVGCVEDCLEEKSYELDHRGDRFTGSAHVGRLALG